MADERDPQVSRRYRELGAEEPPRALDNAILAASRKAVARKRSWYGPVAIAAVLTLAVAVTVQVERQKPADEIVAVAPPPQAQKEKREPRAFKAPASPEQPKPAPSADATRDLAKSNEAASVAQGARQSEAPAEVRSRVDAVQERAASAPASPPAAAQAAPARREMQSSRSHPDVAPEVALGAAREPLYKTGMPETWIEHIAQLRKQGRHDEADKELAEFRRRHPEFRLTDEMRAKVEKK